MRMLNENEENDANVGWEDQKRINAFSTLNQKYSFLEGKYEERKKEKEYLDDLAMELELADEDEPVKYKIGDAFISLPVSEAMSRITADQETISAELETMKKTMDSWTTEMDKLKAELYKKFGKNINLERD